MQIALSGERLAVMLSETELCRLGLTPETLHPRNFRMRRVLRALLQVARRRVGFSPEGRLLMEALPLAGGCLLLLTPQKTPPAAPPPAVYYVAEENALLQLACGLPNHGDFAHRCSLFRMGAGFWIVCYGEPPACAALAECATPIAAGAAAAAAAAEHGQAVFIGDAWERLRACRRTEAAKPKF